ncbi:hypothetical protein B0H13DRAFT_2373791 [Mycena leptocephala]|nr:hypothetical protein B0H13DRAFT_2373791 [Mycena leptocephala]
MSSGHRITYDCDAQNTWPPIWTSSDGDGKVLEAGGEEASLAAATWVALSENFAATPSCTATFVSFPLPPPHASLRPLTPLCPSPSLGRYQSCQKPPPPAASAALYSRSFSTISAKTLRLPIVAAEKKSPLKGKTRQQKACRPHSKRVFLPTLFKILKNPHTLPFLLDVDMEPTTPQHSGGVGELFAHHSHAQQESPSMSSLSGSESSPQRSPQIYGENDLVSHGHLFQGPLPGDAGYVFPDPNATSISAPAIATLTDEYDFDDYDEMSYDEMEAQSEEQVGGGPYALRPNITPSPRANRLSLQAQERRRVAQAAAPALESQSADAAAPGPIPASASGSQTADAPAPGPIPASASGSQTADAPAPGPKPSRARKIANGSMKTPLSEMPPVPQFQLPPTLNHPPPPAAFAMPSAPQQSAPQRPTPQQPAPQRCGDGTSTRRSETPSAPQQPAAGSSTRQARSATPAALQNPAARTSTRQARSATPAALQNPAAGTSSMRQARSATPSQHLAPQQPMRASSLQAPATNIAPVDYAPIPPEEFTGTMPEFLIQAGFVSANLPPPPPTWSAARRRSPQPPPSTLEAKQELMEETLPVDEPDVEPSTGDDNDDDKQNTGGRPTLGQREAFDRAFADIRERMAQCASEARVSYGGVLKAFYQEEHAGLRPGRNSWNLYQRFANYDDGNRLRERRRLDPSYSSATPVPALKADELSRAYKEFVAFTGGEEEAHKVLSLFFQMGGTADDTIQARRRRFHSATKNIEKLTDRFHLDDFFAFTVLVGAHTNEDEKLGAVVTVPGIEEALYEALATNENEIIGIQKTAAAAMIIKEQAKMRREQKDAAAAPSDSGVPSAAAVSSSAARPRRPQPAASAAASAGPAAAASARPAAASARPSPAGEDGAAPETAAAIAAAVLPANTPMLQRDVLCKNTTIFPCEIRDDTPDLQDLRAVMRLASMEDIDVDVFGGKNGFTWTVLARQLHERGVRIINYPDNVRLPSEAPSTKASGSWTRGERRWLRVSLAARATPGQGIRFQHIAHQGDRDFVILSHNYTLTPPDGAPDSASVKAFWSSSTAPVHCTAGDNTTWEAAYNLNDSATLSRPAPSKAEIKAGKAKMEPAPPKAEAKAGKTKAEPAKRKVSSSQKRKADEEDDDEEEEGEEDDELEEEEETSPPTKRSRYATPVAQVGGGELGSPRRVVVPTVKRARKDFTKTPPRVGSGSAPARVRFEAASGSDSDDQPIQDHPARQQPKAPAHQQSKAPPSRKRAAPNDDSEEEYSEDDDAEAAAMAVDPFAPSPRVTRAATKARNPAPSKAGPSKPAAPKVKPVVKVFDAVEVTPPQKKSKTSPAALASEGSKLTSAASGYGPPAPAVATPVIAAPVIAAPAIAVPAASVPAAFPAALPAALAGLTPAQMAQMQTMLFTALFGGAPPGT